MRLEKWLIMRSVLSLGCCPNVVFETSVGHYVVPNKTC